MADNVVLERDTEAGIVRVQTYDKSVESVLKALNYFEYDCGAFNWPVFVTDGGTYYLVKADRRVVAEESPDAD